ncbi:prevent-host-death family protein [Motilibacter peucedani]|uniref:Antitoxin n=1 Tax=Motilibacter peucedani TaxID=598650 RepID=A0A420XTS3_9ACTN|nr:type II toxin-antitoxin system Phd/YefM family antitoxin [Motilibacter peucedani]RKS80243.1 prevent-host-death family protein [Motilibacter peucedani]
MTRTVNVHEAKTHLSRLLEAVEQGEDVVIARAGKPVARLVPARVRGARQPGSWKGRVVIADDFDETPEHLVASFHDEVEPHAL